MARRGPPQLFFAHAVPPPPFRLLVSRGQTVGAIAAFCGRREGAAVAPALQRLEEAVEAATAGLSRLHSQVIVVVLPRVLRG